MSHLHDLLRSTTGAPQIFLAATGLLFPALSEAAEKPNVILIITDDQGYGDIGAHGNRVIQTPSLDSLWAESVRLTDYHVDPTCSPTRTALMSGRYSIQTGVWHTIMGRSLMDPREVTLAEMFQANGYATGMFGKWHLGDNFPLRPEDQGFGYVVRHGGGGVGQSPDYWGNDYFDDTYWRNGVPEKFEGYCTDVWFREGTAFIERNREKPFFCYLSTNAPHGPFYVAEKYSAPYRAKGVGSPMAEFYGMIENIDENVGKLRTRLAELGLAENTIFIFTTDNGTAAGWRPDEKAPDGWKGFNAGMRGNKGSEYDGGHRVPFLVYWPGGGLTGGRDVDQLCAHIDVKPTLADLCGLTVPDGPAAEGVSLRQPLAGDRGALRSRTLFVQSQRVKTPKKWRKTAVMTERWRLVNATELYDIQADPGQSTNVAETHPDVVENLTGRYDRWWDRTTGDVGGFVRIVIGNPAENPARLSSHDWLGESGTPWHQNHVTKGVVQSAPWAVQVDRPGTYRFHLYRWPKPDGRPAGATTAKIAVGGQVREASLDAEEAAATFEFALEAGPTTLQTWLDHTDGKTRGAYYVWAERRADVEPAP